MHCMIEGGQDSGITNGFPCPDADVMEILSSELQAGKVELLISLPIGLCGLRGVDGLLNPLPILGGLH